MDRGREGAGREEGRGAEGDELFLLSRLFEM